MIEDQIDDTLYIGRTKYDAEEIDSVIYVETKRDLSRGDMVDVLVESAYEYDLKGHLVDEVPTMKKINI